MLPTNNTILPHGSQNPEIEKKTLSYPKYAVITLIALAALSWGALAIGSGATALLFAAALTATVGGSGALFYTIYKVIHLFREGKKPVATINPSNESPVNTDLQIAPVGPEAHSTGYQLQNAIHSGDLGLLRTLLKVANPNSPLPNGEFPLHFAVCEEQREAVQILMENGADPFKKDSQEFTAVDQALIQQNWEIVDLLRQKASEQPMTGLRNMPETAPVEPEVNSTIEPTSLKAAEHQLQNAIRSGDLELLKTSLKVANPNSPLPNGELPLHFAVRNEQKEAVQILMENGANPYERDFQQLTAVNHAFLQQSKDILVVLFRQSASKQLISELSNMPKVTKGFFAPILEMAGGGNEQIRNTGNSFADIRKIMNFYMQIFTGVKDGFHQNLNQIELQNAVVEGDLAKIRACGDRGDDVQVPTKHNLTLLHLAAMGNSADVIHLLFDYPVDINATDEIGNTALHYAATNPNGALFDRLIMKGADPLARNSKGVTPLALMQAKTPDPLRLGIPETLMFTSVVVAFLASQLASQAEPASFVSASTASVAAAALTMASLFEFQIHMQRLKDTAERTIAFPLKVFVEPLPVIGLLPSLWRTSKAGKTALNELKSAYNNFCYRPWESTRNAAVYSCYAGLSLFGAGKALYKTGSFMYHTGTSLLGYLFSWNPSASDSEVGDKIGLSEMSGLHENLNGFTNEGFDPNNPLHAVLALCGSNCSLDQLKKAYYELAKKAHPDRNKMENAEEMMTAITKTWETIEAAFLKNSSS
ncbi:MAG: ankyrin repeat domain-containing protein [Chlamydiales bacterium]